MTKNCGNVHPLIQMVDYELPVIILICRVGYSIPLYSGFCVLFVSTLGNNFILEFYLVHVLAHVSNPSIWILMQADIYPNTPFSPAKHVWWNWVWLIKNQKQRSEKLNFSWAAIHVVTEFYSNVFNFKSIKISLRSYYEENNFYFTVFDKTAFKKCVYKLWCDHCITLLAFPFCVWFYMYVV